MHVAENREDVRMERKLYSKFEKWLENNYSGGKPSTEEWIAIVADAENVWSSGDDKTSIKEKTYTLGKGWYGISECHL